MENLITLVVSIIIFCLIMFRMMHYARFYAPSYFFWIGVFFLVIGLFSTIHPLSFLFILNREIAVFILLCGLAISVVSLLCRVGKKRTSTNNQEIDKIMPEFSFNEFHEVRIYASVDKIKQTLQLNGVKDIPIAHLLMKIRGIANDDVDLSDRVSNNAPASNTFSTPDFNFFEVSHLELITTMILKSVIIFDDKKKSAPPEITSIQEFENFDTPGYVKVVMNFRFTGINEQETILSTETRVNGITQNDDRIFGYYWRIIYPGSAIIRRVWLNMIKKKSEK